ncbi:MAG: hypothetical protein ACI80K_003159, partial [Paracoccaceae bacterium]
LGATDAKIRAKLEAYAQSYGERALEAPLER